MCSVFHIHQPLTQKHINMVFCLVRVRSIISMTLEGLHWWLRHLRICLQCRRPRFDSWVGKILWSRKWQPTPVFFRGESHGQRSLVGYSPWGSKESGTIEQLTLSWHLNFIFLGWGNIFGKSKCQIFLNDQCCFIAKHKYDSEVTNVVWFQGGHF